MKTTLRPRTDGQYRQIGLNSRRLHVIRAEKALGKSLPKGVVVHHADGTKDDNAPLVICQDTAYHKLLHLNMRVKKLRGIPNFHRICSACKQLKAPNEMLKRKDRPSGFHTICYTCHYEKRRERRNRQKYGG